MFLTNKCVTKALFFPEQKYNVLGENYNKYQDKMFACHHMSDAQKIYIYESHIMQESMLVSFRKY